MTDHGPEIKPFVAAAGRAISNPVETAFERTAHETPPYQKTIAFLDVCAAVGNIPGTSNQLRTKGPTLWVVDGLYNTRAGTDSYDFGHGDFWVQTDSAGADDRGQLLQVGPYILLPRSGIYFLRGYIATNPTAGAINSSSAVFYSTIYEGVNLAAAVAFLTSRRTNRMGMHRNTTLAAATTAAIVPPLDSGQKIPAATLGNPYGMHFHAYRVTLCNNGANSAVIGVNSIAGIAAGTGFTLAVNEKISFEIPPWSTIYGFSTAGTNITAYWEYI